MNKANTKIDAAIAALRANPRLSRKEAAAIVGCSPASVSDARRHLRSEAAGSRRCTGCKTVKAHSAFAKGQGICTECNTLRMRTTGDGSILKISAQKPHKLYALTFAISSPAEYIGLTCLPLKERTRHHKSQAKTGKQKNPLIGLLITAGAVTDYRSLGEFPSRDAGLPHERAAIAAAAGLVLNIEGIPADRQTRAAEVVLNFYESQAGGLSLDELGQCAAYLPRVRAIAGVDQSAGGSSYQ